jgi:hypothetical protein
VPEHAFDVEQVIREWLDAKQAADGAMIPVGLSNYSGALAIGTEAWEWWAGADAFAEAHASGAPFTAALEHLEAHSHGAVAWAAVRAVIETGEPGGMPVRLTLVLVLEDDGRWRVAQSHASMPAVD